jgi:hypothetical protein
MFYMPEIARFLSRDMIRRPGANLYPYVDNNPTNVVDPLGLQQTGFEESFPRYTQEQLDYREWYRSYVPWAERQRLAQIDELAKVPFYKGYEKDRYQQLDQEIYLALMDFNSDKQKFCGCTPDQSKSVPDLSSTLVKAWFIQEAGGGDPASMAAWKVDPGQVNVPGDWDPVAKVPLGLKQPTRRNEGDLRTNVRAAISFLCRKGYGRSGRAPAPSSTFDGWQKALQRYNARTDLFQGKPYSELYAERIILRATNPNAYTPIEIRR